MYNMYVALHIADPEVSSLVAELARIKGTNKTEALRVLLRDTLAEQQKSEKRKGFQELATNLIAKARKDRVAPAQKSEMDELWGMSTKDGD